MKVLVSDKLAPEGVEVLRGYPGMEVTVQTSWEPGELKEKIKGYSGLVIRSATKVDADVLNAAANRSSRVSSCY